MFKRSKTKIKDMEKWIHSPAQVEILLWYYHSTEDFPNASEHYRQIINDFLTKGMLVANPCGTNPRYSGNRKALEVYVKEVCNVPLPVNKWVIESGLRSFHHKVNLIDKYAEI